MSSIAIAGGSGGRTILSAARSYFIRTTGSDSNDGLTIGTAFATLTHAMTVVSGTIDFGGQTITFDVGAGSFAGFGFMSCVGGGLIQVSGAGSASTTITAGPNDGVFNFGECVDINFVSDTGLFTDKVTLAPSAGKTCYASYVFNGNVGLGNFTAFNSDLIFLLPAGGASDVIVVEGESFFTMTSGGPAINGAAGGCGRFWRLSQNVCVIDAGAWTVSGNPAWSTAFFEADSAAIYEADGSSYTGAATGPRIKMSGVSSASSQTPGSMTLSFFPGSTQGTADPSCFYDGFFGPVPGVNTQTVNYTLAITDAFAVVEMNLAGANTLTVPLNATVAFQIGTKIFVTQIGAGNTTIAGAVGVTVDNAGALSGQWGAATLYKRGTNEWVQTNV